MYQKLQAFFFPVYIAKNLKNKPIAIQLFNKKLVIARLKDELVCFDDNCPHRHVPLSQGDIKQGCLACCYHGWQFNAQGKLAHIPTCFDNETNACHQNIDDIQLVNYPCYEHNGWIWVSIDRQAQFNASYYDDFDVVGFDCYDYATKMTANFIHAIENFLDPTHTPFIHDKLLRNSSTKTAKSQQSMYITQSQNEHGFVTHYQLTEKQNGLINKLFDKGIDVNVARFTLPSLTTISYQKNKELLYKIALFFIPISDTEVGLSVKVFIPKNKVPASIKFSLLRPFLLLLLYQDSAILKQQYHTHADFEQKYIVHENDLVIGHLLHFLKDLPKAENKQGLMVLMQ